MSMEGSNALSDKNKKEKRSSVFRAAVAAATLGSLAPNALPAHETRSIATASYVERDRARDELAASGITRAQRERGYKPGLSEALARGLSPFKYSNETNALGQDPSVSFMKDAARFAEGFAVGTVENRNEATREDLVKEIRQNYPDLTHEQAERFFDARMDAFRLYLGLPQLHGTFGISDAKPHLGKQDMYYYRINNFLKNYEDANSTYDPGHEGDPRFRHPLSEKDALSMLVGSAQPEGVQEDPQWSNVDSASGIMGRYALSKGHDERGYYVSYYDRWDLGGSVEGQQGVVGAPFEIYDRIYYDPHALGLDRNPLSGITVLRKDEGNP
jgi:hypothetical protein